MTNVNPDPRRRPEPYTRSPEEAGATARSGAGGFPFKGLALVLIIVAILLGLWGLYSLTQGGGDDDSAAAGNTTTQETSALETSAQETAASDTSPVPATATLNSTEQDAPAATSPVQGATVTSERPQSDAERAAASQRAEERAQQDRRAEADQRSEAERRQPAAPQYGEPLPAERSSTNTVNVYNNSTVTGLAARTSDRLRGEGYEVGVEAGNIPESQMVLAETTVFFDPNVDGAEQRARELADQVGGVARANAGNLPAEATDEGALALVLAGQGG